MDYWGLNRSRRTVRVRALERLCSLDTVSPSGDLVRLAAALAPRGSSPAGTTAAVGAGTAAAAKATLYPREYEILIAIATAVANAPPKTTLVDAAPVLIRTLAPRMNDMLTMELKDAITLRGAHFAPWYDVTHKIVQALCTLDAPPAVFEDFLHTASNVWAALTAAKDQAGDLPAGSNTSTNDTTSTNGSRSSFGTSSQLRNGSDTWHRFVRWAFALRGFFDGLSVAKGLSPSVAAIILEWLSDNVDEEFGASLHRNIQMADIAAHEEIAVSLAELPDATSSHQLGSASPPPLEATCIVQTTTRSYPGAVQLALSFSRFASAYVRLLVGSGQRNAIDAALDGTEASLAQETTQIDTVSFKKLAEFSERWARELESGVPFAALLDSNTQGCVSLAIWHHFEVLGAAVRHKLFDAETAFELLLVVTGGDVGAAAEALYADPLVDAQLNMIRLAMVCGRGHESRLASLTKTLPGYLGAIAPAAAGRAAKIFVAGLKGAPQSWLLTALYALANTVSLDEINARRTQLERSAVNVPAGSKQTSPIPHYGDGNGANSSSSTSGLAANSALLEHALGRYACSLLTGLVAMAKAYGDAQVNGLVLTILTQKFGQVSLEVDCAVLGAFADLAPGLCERDFEALLLQLARIERSARSRDRSQIVDAVESTRVTIAKSLAPHRKSAVLGSLYQSLMAHLLQLWIGVGDSGAAKAQHHRPQEEISQASKELLSLIAPLAALLPSAPEPPLDISDWQTIARFRDAWFNAVIVGLSFDTKWTTCQAAQLATIARSTPPLVSEASANMIDSDLELNPVLLRGSSNTNVAAQRRVLNTFVNSHTTELLRMPFHKLMFMSAAILLESFRARAGIASKVPLYFGDPDFRAGQLNHTLEALANQCMREYIACINSRPIHDRVFAHTAVARQLKALLVMCCHRVDAIRTVALAQTDSLVTQVPSSLCHRDSLFALLDLLTLVWESCIDAEEDEYEPRMQFSSSRTGIEIDLSDSYEMRRQTLRTLLTASRKWGSQTMALLGDELKSLLTVYLDDMDDPADAEGASFDKVSLGRSFALELGGTVRECANSKFSGGSNRTGARSLADGSSGFLSQYLALADYRIRFCPHASESSTSISELVARYEALLSVQNPLQAPMDPRQLHRLYTQTAPFLAKTTPVSLRLAKEAVHLPFRSFNVQLIRCGIMFWLWATHANPELRMSILQAVGAHWSRSVYRKVGLFSREHDTLAPLNAEMRYAPTNKRELDAVQQMLTRLYEPHVALIEFLRSSFHATINMPGAFLDEFAGLLTDALYGLENYASMHPLARTARLELVRLSLETLGPYARLRPRKAAQFSGKIIKAALAWYKQPPCWPYGGNMIQQRRDVHLLSDVINSVRQLMAASPERQLLLFFMQDELARIQVWREPLSSSRDTDMLLNASTQTVNAKVVGEAWLVDPELAVWLLKRRCNSAAKAALVQLIDSDPLRVVRVPAALQYFLEAPISARRRFVLYWAQVSPIESIVLFSPNYGGDSLLLQFAMRSLECHPVLTSFFYVPHIVQMLRHDHGGYVEEYILEAAKFSQLFAHQIIWNINANAWKDDEASVPDDMKPTLDRVLKRIKEAFSEEEREYYETEFGFFNEITSISGKLKSYIKKSKAEKKAKIDEEMAKIKLPQGAYLPSNPHGVVVDIDRESGKPLQSHAKAPFLARFKIRKDDLDTKTQAMQKEGDGPAKENCESRAVSPSRESWQGAIFKVGDDCRQDVLVLQILAVFQSIFNYTGIDCYLFPYKVTATGPGMGVIDVLPNSISRDMLGREAVNGLYEWFVSKHGSETSIDMQRARNNFVKSMAAYSVVSYLLQFKDRHNGNIMYDDDGHVIHIDFGFIFDIVPGGVKFEAVPFKLTKEMVAVMGGSSHTQPFRWFEELCVKAFLASRVHAEDIVRMVSPMLESGLPCFTPHTIKRLRARFVLNKTEREAAQYMRGLIAKSYESTFTKGYDEFQRITNGIPY